MARTIREATAKPLDKALSQPLRLHVIDWRIVGNFARRFEALKLRMPYEAIKDL